MSIQKNPYPLRIDDDLMEKIRIVAKENGRSVNKEIEILVKIAIQEYESVHGEIHL